MATVPRVSANAMVDPVMEMMKDLIQKEDNRQILQTDLSPMETLLHYTDIFFRYPHKNPPETVKIWLQLLHNSLRQANGLFHRSRPRQSCLDCVVCNPGRLSKEIRDWNALFNHLYHGFLSDFQYIVLSGNAIAVDPVTDLLKDVIEKEDSRQILQIDLRPMENLLQDFTTLFQPMDSLLQIDLRPMDSLLRDFITFFQPEKKALWEIMAAKFWLPLLLNYLTEAKGLLDSSAPGQSFIDSVSKEIREWTAYFNKVYHDFQSHLSIFVTSLQFLSSNPLHIEEKAEEPTVIQPLSRDEAWMLFRRVAAFKDDQVSVDIQDNARRFADECKGMPFAINIVAAMIGQTNVDQWDTCFSLMKTVDPSFQATHRLLDAQLYRLLRWSYDALPNSNVKNCFLYCAFFMENQEVDSRELVQMWIGEGLVKSKQGTYLMDMALARKYLQLLIDRCFFQIVKDSTTVFREESIREQAHDFIPSIRVHAAIREMAMYIGQKEENCLFIGSQNLRNFPEVHNNNCRRISVADNFDEHLPTDMRCAELASLILKGDTNLKELPSDFLLSLTSLRVLNLSGCTEITSLPTSMGQLKLLEFLSLSGLRIKYLPDEICNLSRLQFLNLSKCGDLESLPSKIAQLTNLKCLDLDLCDSLRVIPHEMSQLTSLSRLVFPFVVPYRGLSMETEAPASIWSLKGLKNMTELSVVIDPVQPLKDGIMGTWSEMRHLMLNYGGSGCGTGDLPEDMKSMKKLQSFVLQYYGGSSLPNCKFEHLEVVTLYGCDNIKELFPLEWMPNLKLLKLEECDALRELGIGSRGSGSPSGYQRLQKLVLNWLYNLESLGGASKRGVWDERTLPHLRVLKIRDCPSLKRFPVGMEKLPNLCALMGEDSWWRSIMWEDEDMKTKLEKNFKSY